ncbi:glycosyltransferase 6 domain-containing protein 1-like isoform X2 [Tupaia chinensis]|uniref:glycosyltransferase 6 domain-containing protein 1-like isoform X2 n=1 Tax=Tupaia chinensis TaxID=246437 RepID=UPI0003C8E39C|nr:glycosyltransferase 6 domain-containing protein 1-like isoform X2 [Tupaia chinensis]
MSALAFLFTSPKLKDRMTSQRKMMLLILCALSLILIKYYFRNDQVEEPQLSAWFNSANRSDVITTTNWHAPIIWEGTYNREVLEKYYKRLNITIGLAVIAPAGIIRQYLKEFIQSANKHFMTGYNVIFYILTDNLNKVPHLELGLLRTMKLFFIPANTALEDYSLWYMKHLETNIIDFIQYEVEFLFKMDINQIFKDDFGVETLGRSVAQLHGWWYFKNTEDLPYEKRSLAAAAIPSGQGDFYYHSTIFGGTPQEILALLVEYEKGFTHDTSKDINSNFESHLNKYFFVHKPAKLLSPEYNWESNLKTPPQIKHVKIEWQSVSIENDYMD